MTTKNQIIDPETIFTPSSPATGLTFSRRAENTDLSNYLREPGSQVLIYGQTGIGKTSLALYSLNDAHNFIRYQCNSDTTFEKIINYFTGILLGPQPSEVQVDVTTGKSLQLGLDWGRAQYQRTRGFREIYDTKKEFNAEHFIFALGPECWKLMIDDFERITCEQTKSRVAQLTKSFSDQAPLVPQGESSSSAAKIIIIGIAETMNQLLVGDASTLGRVMCIHLKPLIERQVKEFLVNGFDYLGVKCDPRVLQSFIELAAGYPRYAHALALAACRVARDEGTTFISQETGARAVSAAIRRYESIFEDTFAYASRSRRGGRRVHAKLLRAMANIRQIDCEVEEILVAAQEIDPSLTPRHVTTALGELTSKSRRAVLRRPRDQRGTYTFSDALFKSYVRMKYFDIQLSEDLD